MPARDLLHPVVVRCLTAEGWQITHDPYAMGIGRKTLFVDLGAEKVIAAERGNTRIAVEIKSFQGRSDVHDLEEAVGQFVIYTALLQIREPERVLYLAMPVEAYTAIFDEPLGRAILDAFPLRLLIVDADREVIVQWIPGP